MNRIYFTVELSKQINEIIIKKRRRREREMERQQKQLQHHQFYFYKVNY